MLGTTTSSVTMNVPGTTSSPVNLTNTGGSSLNWSATLQSGAPAFVSLSTTSGSSLAAGAMSVFNVVVNANTAASGTYQTSVTISATDTATGLPVNGSPITIPITITVASSIMQVSATTMAFSALSGGTVNPQSLTIANTGGGTISWTVTSPTTSWLSISTKAGSTTVGTGSTLTFSILTNGLAASSTAYTDQVVITPSGGNPVTISISLLITDPTPTPTPTATPFVTPTATAVPTPIPSATSNTVFVRKYT